MINERRRQRAQMWRTYLDSCGGEVSSTVGYHYPTSEADTGKTEEVQDPGKREREIGVILESMGTAWLAALDFGCGTGSNFDVFAKSAANNRSDAEHFVVAIDADQERTKVAQRSVPATRGIEFVVRNLTIDAVENAPADLTFDYILCCQVLGHTSEKLTGRILRSLAARLDRGGTLCVLVPYCTSRVTALPFARELPAGADLLHLVDLSKSPASPGFRRLLNGPTFDEAADSPMTYLLPVRCFLTSLPEGQTGLGRLAATAVPKTIAAALDADFSADATIYSTHVAGADGYPLIGDIRVNIVKTGG